MSSYSYAVECGGRPFFSTSALYGGGEVCCRGDGGSTPHLQRYENASLGVVVHGAFHYEYEGGQTLATPGTLLFGAAAEEFSFSFPKPEPVRRSVIAIHPSVIEELSADLDLPATAFGSGVVGPLHGTLGIYGAIRRLAASSSKDDEALLALGAAAFRLRSKATLREPSQGEMKRVSEVAAYLNTAYAEQITLDDMAAKANLSRFHFIRVFGRVTGERPRQYLLAARLRAASDRLLQTSEPIISVALNSGFNDISNFTNTFRRTFGMSPRQWRAVT